MARPRKSDGAAADDKLIEAFWDCLGQTRLPDISISAITKRANLNRGTFYYHFHDLDELLEQAIEREFDSHQLLLSIFDLIAGTPDPASAATLVQQRTQRAGLFIDRGGLDVLSLHIKRLVRQMWTAILCDEGQQLKPETLFVIEYTTSGIIGLIANDEMRKTAQSSPEALNSFLKSNSAFLLGQIERAQGVPHEIALTRIQATRRASRIR